MKIMRNTQVLFSPTYSTIN